MRKLILICLVFGSMVCKADQKLPKKIKDSFEKKYAQSSEVNWTLIDDEYNISFQQKGLSKMAIFGEKGEWIKTTTSLMIFELKECLTEIVDTEYFGAEIHKAELVETPDDASYFLTITVEDQDYGDEETEEDEEEKQKKIILKFNNNCELIDEG